MPTEITLLDHPSPLALRAACIKLALQEIFDTLEALPGAPAKLVGGFLSWARGEQDPDWGKKPSDKPKAPRPW
jgi:hypothetical protein